MINTRWTDTPKRHTGCRTAEITAGLQKYSSEIRTLLGINHPDALNCLVRQIIDSIRRVTFAKRLAGVRYTSEIADPTSDRFDPLKAAVFRANRGDADEAIWLAFLAVHFGKHSKDGWTLARLVYGRIGEEGLWDWQSVSANPADFRRWLAAQYDTLRRFRFSNHRAYESLSAHSQKGTGSIVESFVTWIVGAGSFATRVRSEHQRIGQNPADVFQALYLSMASVQRFGRLGKFDFLTMVGKLGLAPIEPGSAYIWDGATGPYRGICLLINGSASERLKRGDADEIYKELGQALNLGMQELEDALCNWQKSQTFYKYFRG